MNAIAYAALGTGFTFLLTSAGAAVVFFLKIKSAGIFRRDSSALRPG